MGKDKRPPGRARNEQIDARVLEVAQQHLARVGFEAMSLAAIAEEAGTSRQALYRRWPGKASLAAAAVLTAADDPPKPSSGDPFQDLVSELRSFQRGVSRPGRLSLAGTMLQDSTDSETKQRYRAQVVAPRRGRLRAILERARDARMIDSDADLDLAVTMLTGSWYARELAGVPPPPRWPERAAALVWRSAGGTVPPTSKRA